MVLLWHFHTLDPNFLLQASEIKEFLPWDLLELLLRPFVIYSLPALGQFSKEHSVQFSSVQLLSHFWLCNPMDCSTPSFPVYHQLPELTQTHVHWVSDTIQPSHPLSSPFPLCKQRSQRTSNVAIGDPGASEKNTHTFLQSDWWTDIIITIMIIIIAWLAG